MSASEAKLRTDDAASPAVRLDAGPMGGVPGADTGRRLKRPRKRVISLIAAVLVLVAAAIYGWRWWNVGRFLEETDNAYVRADIVVISPKIPGYVTQVAVEDNQPVRAGDILLRIEDRDYRARVDQAQADADAAEARVAAGEAAIANIDAQMEQQRSVITQAEALAQSAAADARRTELDYNRYRSLVGQQVASRQRLETADADYRKAAASIARSRAAIASERGKLPVLETQRRQAEAALKQARATLKAAQAAQALARIDLEHTTVRAPFDGVVGQRSVRLGQFVERGMPLMAVVPLQAAYVVANYKETQLSAMRPGQPAEIEVDTFADTKLHGRVGSFSPAAGSQFALLPPDNATGNFTKIVQRVPVKILLDPDNPLAGRLRPGMSVIATVDTRGEAREQPAPDRARGQDGR